MPFDGAWSLVLKSPASSAVDVGRSQDADPSWPVGASRLRNRRICGRTGWTGGMIRGFRGFGRRRCQSGRSGLGRTICAARYAGRLDLPSDLTIVDRSRCHTWSSQGRTYLTATPQNEQPPTAQANDQSQLSRTACVTYGYVEPTPDSALARCQCHPTRRDREKLTSVGPGRLRPHSDLGFCSKRLSEASSANR